MIVILLALVILALLWPRFTRWLLAAPLLLLVFAALNHRFSDPAWTLGADGLAQWVIVAAIIIAPIALWRARRRSAQS